MASKRILIFSIIGILGSVIPAATSYQGDVISGTTNAAITVGFNVEALHQMKAGFYSDDARTEEYDPDNPIKLIIGEDCASADLVVGFDAIFAGEAYIRLQAVSPLQGTNDAIDWDVFLKGNTETNTPDTFVTGSRNSYKEGFLESFSSKRPDANEVFNENIGIKIMTTSNTYNSPEYSADFYVNVYVDK